MSRSSRRPRRAGFTLMEVLLVLVILVVLASISVGVFRSTREKALIDSTRTKLANIATQINAYDLHYGNYPRTLEDLANPPALPDGTVLSRKHEYVQEKDLFDAWGAKIQYLQEGKSDPSKFELWSMGPNGQDGDDNDIYHN